VCFPKIDSFSIPHSFGIGSQIGNSFLVQNIRRDNRNSPVRPPHVVDFKHGINFRHPVHRERHEAIPAFIHADHTLLQHHSATDEGFDKLGRRQRSDTVLPAMDEVLA
jgi:hypothetical protein